VRIIDMNEALRVLTRRLERGAPPSEQALGALLSAIDFALPSDYLEFIRESDGAEGWVGEAYLAIWPLHEVVETHRDRSLPVYGPRVVYFAGNGGLELYAFDASAEMTTIVEVPRDSIDQEDARPCGTSFEELLRFIRDRAAAEEAEDSDALDESYRDVVLEWTFPNGPNSRPIGFFRKRDS